MDFVDNVPAMGHSLEVPSQWGMEELCAEACLRLSSAEMVGQGTFPVDCGSNMAGLKGFFSLASHRSHAASWSLLVWRLFTGPLWAT